jgi:hypothetical protein
MDLEVLGQVATVADLITHGWDERCVPYGGDRTTRCSEFVEANTE